MTQIHPTAIVDPKAQLGVDVEIGPYTVVGPQVRLGDRTRIMAHAYLDGDTTLGAGCTVFPFASVGTQTQDLKYAGGHTRVEIGDHTTLREYTTVHAATADGGVTRIGSHCHIMAYAHVAHECGVGNHVIISNCGTLGGHVQVEDMVTIGGLTGVHQFCRIGTMAMIGGCGRIVQDVPPYMIAEGNPMAIHGPNRVGMERRQVSPEAREAVKQAYRLLYRSGLSTSQAVERIRGEVPALPEIRHLLDFIQASERGIIK